jgi:hypothetical protein
LNGFLHATPLSSPVTTLSLPESPWQLITRRFLLSIVNYCSTYMRFECMLLDASPQHHYPLDLLSSHLRFLVLFRCAYPLSSWLLPRTTLYISPVSLMSTPNTPKRRSSPPFLSQHWPLNTLQHQGECNVPYYAQHDLEVLTRNQHTKTTTCQPQHKDYLASHDHRLLHMDQRRCHTSKHRRTLTDLPNHWCPSHSISVHQGIERSTTISD